jgi:ATP-dependent Clp protease protease subunit
VAQRSREPKNRAEPSTPSRSRVKVPPAAGALTALPPSVAPPAVVGLAPEAAGLSLADRRALLEIRKLELESERAALELDSMRRREAELAADPSRARAYTFYTDVTQESVRECMHELGQWSRRDPGAPITLTFNSPGGSVLDGFALFDFLRQLRSIGHHLTTVALGRAASMGAVLLQAGDHRIMGQNAFLLIHEVSNLSAGKVSELEDSVEFSRRLQKRLLAILAERSSLSEAQIQRRWARKEWWLDAEEAVALGLADAVL